MLNIILQYIFSSTKLLYAFSTKKSLVLVPSTVYLSYFLTVSNEEKAIYLLLGLMILDFITGIGASKEIRRKLIKDNLPVPERLIESKKLRLSGVKFALYSSTILTAWAIHHIFIIKNFSIGISEKPAGIVLILTGFWCLVELYSILFENFKIMGIDVLSIFDKIKEIYIKIKS